MFRLLNNLKNRINIHRYIFNEEYNKSKKDLFYISVLMANNYIIFNILTDNMIKK